MTTLEQAVVDHAAAIDVIVSYLRSEWWHEEYAGKTAAAILAGMGEAGLLLSREEPLAKPPLEEYQQTIEALKMLGRKATAMSRRPGFGGAPHETGH